MRPQPNPNLTSCALLVLTIGLMVETAMSAPPLVLEAMAVALAGCGWSSWQDRK